MTQGGNKGISFTSMAGTSNLSLAATIGHFAERILNYAELIF